MKQEKSIMSSAVQVTIILFIIKLLGVAKQAIIAAVCGATGETDAYFVATGVIVALCSILFSSISISLLTLYTQRLIDRGRAEANNLLNAVLRVFLPVSAVVTAIFAVGSRMTAQFLAPSYEGTQLETLSQYIRLMSVMFIFTCYYLIINVVLETDKRFLPGKGQSLFQNLFICVAAVVVYPRYGTMALIYAFLLAGVVQCIQITWSARHEFRFVWRVQPEREAIGQLLALSLPLIVGNAIYEINDIVDKQIATGLGHGNVSYLSYGASINEIVTTLIVSSVTTVLFSHYATWIAEGNIQRVGDGLKKSLEYIVLLIMPIMVMCFVCGDCIVDILYGRGSFDAQAAAATTSVVAGYAAGFLFQAARANLVKVFYAFNDTRTPMINGAVSIVINVLCSLALSRVIGVGGIALATSISMLVH